MYVLVCIGLFSMPFAADFGPALERASEGAQLEGEFAFFASYRRLRAWPGGEHDIFFLRQSALFLHKVKYPT